MGQHGISLLALNEKFEALAKDHNLVVARVTALQAVVAALAWGIGRSREEVGQRILEIGSGSLATLNSMPEPIQREVTEVWNDAYAQVMDPGAAPSFIGIKP